MKTFAKGAMAAALIMGAATPALAAPSTVDTTFYSDLLSFVKAQFAFEGAEYSAFQSLNLSDKQLKSLSDAFAGLNSAQLTLVNYLQTKVTTS